MQSRLRLDGIALSVVVLLNFHWSGPFVSFSVFEIDLGGFTDQGGKAKSIKRK